jgi:hypothetical protein
MGYYLEDPTPLPGESPLECNLTLSLQDIQRQKSVPNPESAPVPAPPPAAPPERPVCTSPLSGVEQVVVRLSRRNNRPGRKPSLGHTNRLVDAYAECMLHAARHGLAIKPEDVRTLLVTAFINPSQGVALLCNWLYTANYLDILFPLPVQEKAMRSAYALRRWLAREILECEIPRKPPNRANKSTGPARDARYRAWIRSLRCCVCGLESAGEAAHTGRVGGMRQKAPDYSCIPLCRNCQAQNAESYHRMGRAEFERRHRLDLAGIVIRLNRDWV